MSSPARGCTSSDGPNRSRRAHASNALAEGGRLAAALDETLELCERVRRRYGIEVEPVRPARPAWLPSEVVPETGLVQR